MNSYEDLAMMLGKEEMLADAFKDCLLSHLKELKEKTDMTVKELKEYAKKEFYIVNNQTSYTLNELKSYIFG